VADRDVIAPLALITLAMISAWAFRWTAMPLSLLLLMVLPTIQHLKIVDVDAGSAFCGSCLATAPGTLELKLRYKRRKAPVISIPMPPLSCTVLLSIRAMLPYRYVWPRPVFLTTTLPSITVDAGPER